MPRKRWLFGAICLVAALIAGSYAAVAMRRGKAVAEIAPLATQPGPPYLMSLSVAPGDTYRRLLLSPLSAADGAAYSAPLTCERAYFSSNRGVCLTREGVIPQYFADVFDERFNRRHRIPLSGLPSRTRLSSDGRRAGITVFEHGHSYAEDGFSTRTIVVDTIAGKVLGDLEQFEVTRDGAGFRAVDFNFWGLTFAQDGNRFFATLATGGSKYLVEGDVNARTMRVVRDGVECPSLSPDNTRIAYKSVVNNEGTWRLRVYDLRSGSDTLLSAETRSVDDQVDWLDNDHVLYHITGESGADIWSLRTDGVEPPRVLRRQSYSPAIIR